MKETRVCSLCNKKKTILKSSWYANNECSACRARSKYKDSGRHEYKKKWREENKDHCLKRNREYIKQKMKDPTFRIKKNLRNRLNQAFKNNQKTGSAIDELGCSIDKLKEHLESQFADGMTFDNYGEWHIDHIKPLDSFDLTNKEEMKKACNYTNLQPLWAEDNFKKGVKDEY